MKVVKRKISELIPADYNPRRLTEKQEKHLTESLTEFGLVDPVIVNMNSDRKNIIIGGHQRLKVWQKLGNKEIDCVELDLSIEKEKELNIRLNANTGEWDIDLLLDGWGKLELEAWGVELDFGEKIEISKEGDIIEDLGIRESIQVIPKNEYIIITEPQDSKEWEELKTLFKCETVRSGGCKIGSSSDKVGTGLERVFNLKTFKERVGL